MERNVELNCGCCICGDTNRIDSLDFSTNQPSCYTGVARELSGRVLGWQSHELGFSPGHDSPCGYEFLALIGHPKNLLGTFLLLSSKDMLAVI